MQLSTLSKILITELFIINCAAAYATSPSTLISPNTSSAIHITHVLTNGNEIPGTLTARFGTGSECTITHQYGPLNMIYYEGAKLKLSSAEVERELGTGVTCITETYKTDKDNIDVAYNVTYDKTTNHYVVVSHAFIDTITLH